MRHLENHAMPFPRRHTTPDLGPGSSPFAAEHRGWSWRDEPGPCRGAVMDSERGQGRAEWPPFMRILSGRLGYVWLTCFILKIARKYELMINLG